MTTARGKSFAVLPLLLACWSLPGRAVAQEPPDFEMTGEEVTGAPGITETVDEIMDRGARLPTGALAFREKKEIYGNRDKQPDPLAPEVAMWPPLDAARELEGVPPLLGRIPP